MISGLLSNELGLGEGNGLGKAQGERVGLKVCEVIYFVRGFLVILAAASLFYCFYWKFYCQ